MPNKFRDYVSAYDECRRRCKKLGQKALEGMQAFGVDMKSFESYYEFEFSEESKMIEQRMEGRFGSNWKSMCTEWFSMDHETFFGSGGNDSIAAMLMQDTTRGVMLASEAMWYRHSRPYFNVYPVIEKKFMELNDEIIISELHMPFPVIEVRTLTKTILMADYPSGFFFVVDFPDGSFQEFFVTKASVPIKSVKSANFLEIDRVCSNKSYGQCLSEVDRNNIVYLAAGTCLLAKDENVVKPVVLAADYRDEMSEQDLKKYAEKAAKRNGRVGFEVGKKIEKMQASIHYRNGCFAKYYVGPTHKSYPNGAALNLAPIIQWRCGSVVNAKNIPKVPTGFKGAEENYK